MSKTLVDAFSGEGAQRVATIFGMDGIGKTELALKVAETLSRDYPDAGLLFELQPGNVPLTPAALLGQVIHTFQPELRLTEDLAALQALYRQSLIGQRGALLLDNAADAGQVSPLLPPPTGWAVIVTVAGPLRAARCTNARPRTAVTGGGGYTAAPGADERRADGRVRAGSWRTAGIR